MKAGAVLAALLAALPLTALAQSPPGQAPSGPASGQSSTGNDASDNVIDDRIRASAAAAESLQGPLDGAWTLVTATGQPLYAFQIVDKPGGREPPEAVWRDLRRANVAGDIGIVDTLTRDSTGLTFSFVAKPGDPAVTVTLTTGADGAWSGQMKAAGTATDVKLRRN